MMSDVANGHEAHLTKAVHNSNNISGRVIHKTETPQEIDSPKKRPPEAPKTKPKSPAEEKSRMNTSIYEIL